MAVPVQERSPSCGSECASYDRQFDRILTSLVCGVTAQHTHANVSTRRHGASQIPGPGWAARAPDAGFLVRHTPPSAVRKIALPHLRSFHAYSMSGAGVHRSRVDEYLILA